MSNQNKIIIAFLFLIVIIVIAWFIQKERQYQACLDVCQVQSLYSNPLYSPCKAECKEKYGK